MNIHVSRSRIADDGLAPELRTRKPAGEAAAAGTPRETAQGCRDRAAADLVASNAMMTAHQRTRLETSAASWTMRAAMLQRVEDGAQARARATAAVMEARS